MTINAPQAAARIRQALEQNPTQGPWFQAHRPDHEGMHATQVFGADLQTIATFDWLPRRTVDGVTETHRAANAAFVAACDPPALRAILDRMDELAKDAATMREALTEAEPLLAQLLEYLDKSLPNGARMPALDKVRAALTPKELA